MLFSQTALSWMKNYWWTSVILSLLYVGTIFVLRTFMKDRKPFELRILLTMWNTGLAVFSFLGLTCLIPELLWLVSNFFILRYSEA